MTITNISLVTVYCLDQTMAGQLGGLGLRTDDCRKAFEELSGKGVTFPQEPADLS